MVVGGEKRKKEDDVNMTNEKFRFKNVKITVATHGVQKPYVYTGLLLRHDDDFLILEDFKSKQLVKIPSERVIAVENLKEVRT